MDPIMLGAMVLVFVILASLVSVPVANSPVIIIPAAPAQGNGGGLLAALVLIGILLIAMMG